MSNEDLRTILSFVLFEVQELWLRDLGCVSQLPARLILQSRLYLQDSDRAGLSRQSGHLASERVLSATDIAHRGRFGSTQCRRA